MSISLEGQARIDATYGMAGHLAFTRDVRRGGVLEPVAEQFAFEMQGVVTQLMGNEIELAAIRNHERRRPEHQHGVENAQLSLLRELFTEYTGRTTPGLSLGYAHLKEGQGPFKGDALTVTYANPFGGEPTTAFVPFGRFIRAFTQSTRVQGVLEHLQPGQGLPDGFLGTYVRQPGTQAAQRLG